MLTAQWTLGAVALISLIAAASDLRSRRIPNWLSIPALAAGLLLRGIAEGTGGLADAAAGLAIGAGPLLVLWLIGGGGGGDVKLMGALAVWLGYRGTVLLLLASAVAVLVVHLGVLASRAARPRGTATQAETRHGVRIAFAIPVCVAAWSLVAFEVAQALAAP